MADMDAVPSNVTDVPPAVTASKLAGRMAALAARADA
jgi:hypothetical protein